MPDLPCAVICSLNSKYVHSSLAPWYLAAGVRTYCPPEVSAAVVEGTVNEPMEDVALRITALRPRVVGFCCYIWNIGAALRLIRHVKTGLPGTVIVLGGPEAGYNAAALLEKNPSVDYIIAGEGERPFAMLLTALLRQKEPCGIPGLCRRSEEGTLTAPPHISDEEPPSPYCEAYFKALGGRIAYLETGRGCPYSCAFCLSGAGGGARFFSLERAEREILLLSRSGARTVKFVDRTFNCNRERAYAIFSFILSQYGGLIPSGTCFHFEIAGDLLDERTLVLLESAPPGAIRLEIGVQSFNPATLEAVTRKTDTGLLRHNIRRLCACGRIIVHLDLIAGLPYEDMQSFADGFNTAYALGPSMLQLGFLKLLHGSAMRQNPDRYPCRYAEEAPYEVTETPWLTAAELRRLHRVEDALERLYNSGRFRRTLALLLLHRTPFELFDGVGAHLAKQDCARISLDAFTDMMYGYFTGLQGTDPGALRDAMVCDRLSTNASGRLPTSLRVQDPALRRATALLRSKDPPQKGVRRGVALLYGRGEAVYADYREKHPVTGEYPLRSIKLPDTPE